MPSHGGHIEAVRLPIQCSRSTRFHLGKCISTAWPGLATFWGAYEMLLCILPERTGLPPPISNNVYRAFIQSVYCYVDRRFFAETPIDFRRDTQPVLELVTARCLFLSQQTGMSHNDGLHPGQPQRSLFLRHGPVHASS